MTTQFDEVRAAEATRWIEEVTGQRLSGDFQSSLKDGVILCKLINKLKPGTIAKINTQRMPFMQMENIAAYIQACRDLGVPDRENFMTVDLFEGKNLGQVVQNIISLKRLMGFGFERESGLAARQVSLSGADETVPSRGAGTLAEEPTALMQTTGGTAFLPGKAQNTEAFQCSVCTKLISSGCVNACGLKWHSGCFNCKRCATNLARAKYFEFGGKPYCDRCILIVNPTNTVRAHTTDKGFTFGRT
jgi:hypothetical protein